MTIILIAVLDDTVNDDISQKKKDATNCERAEYEIQNNCCCTKERSSCDATEESNIHLVM